MRILIVEDEVGIAWFLERAQGAEGFATEVATDGEHGAALALTGNFDLVLLDVMLPRRWAGSRSWRRFAATDSRSR